MAVGRELRVHVDEQLVLNNTSLILDVGLAGFGLAYVPEDQVRAHLADGRLVRVLADWCPPFSGYHLYTRAAASRRPPSPCWWMRCATAAGDQCFPRLVSPRSTGSQADVRLSVVPF